MTAEERAHASPDVWERAGLAAALMAIEPVGAPGLHLRSPAGPLRDFFLQMFTALLPPNLPIRRMPAHIPDGRLLGGLDLAASLAVGRPVAERGLLAEADGGLIILAMAERLPAATVARLNAVHDCGEVNAERDGLTLTHRAQFGLLALDEGIDSEIPPTSLLERLAISIDLEGLSQRDQHLLPFTREGITAASKALASITIDDDRLIAVSTVALMLGVFSLRFVVHAISIAKRHAALQGRDRVEDEDVAIAAVLVLAPRATQIPSQDESEAETPEPSPEEDQPENSPPPDQLPPLEDIVLEAAKAAIPPGLLEQLRSGVRSKISKGAGRAGQVLKSANRGRIIGARAGSAEHGARLDVIETLRAAAPWQRLRREAAAKPHAGLYISRTDFRVSRFKNRQETTTIFVVDTSGSAALQRLAEAKGAVRLLLAECYVRRDEVALIAFRNKSADLILPPTRALARAQRALAAMPGGGGTPMANAIDAAASLADQVRRTGRSPHIVFMTDGRANIARDGSPGRPRALADARLSARRLASQNFSTILIDTAPQPQVLANELATALAARCVHLPYADARKLAAAISASAA